MSYKVNPNARSFDPTFRCEYHSNAQGHSTKNCFTLKRAIEKLIDDKAIVIHDEEAPNVTNNPLPPHNNAHVVGMICDDKEYKQTGKTIMEIDTLKEGLGMVTKSAQEAPLCVKGASSNANLKGSGKLILFGQNQNGLRKMTEPIVIKHMTQILVTNIKTVPWNYNKTTVTYKGKEIGEEIDETGGLTRSGRCYAPEELRRAKQARDSQFPVKKPITEEQAEKFMKKMKVQDYSIVDHLRKTPAQISLLSLLIHSKEHCQALIRILNEAHVSDKTTVSHLEKMANRIFEVNRITFTDDELPVEGTGHNKALHLTVKCEEHYVKRVMIDGGSGVDICPLFTLQSLKISTDRIRTNNPWIHAARAVPSTLHQVVKFEYEKQEIIVHGEDDLLIYRDPSVPCVEAKEGCESLIFQTFEIVAADQFMEGKPILEPRLSSTSVMVATQMLQNGYEPGKGLGVSLQGIVDPISPFGNQDTFGLGFRPTNADRKWAKEQKNKIGEGPNHADVQRIGLEVELANWEATPLPTKKESCFVNADFNNMTCMRNSRPDLKELSNLEIMNQEVDEYDEEEAFEEIKRELDQFENKPKPNLNETESYDDMPGLSVDLVVHKLPTYPDFPPVQQKQRKFKKEVSDKIKEEIMKQLSANVIRVVRFTTWLANVVPVPKKDGKTRVCVDYRDLNKASPKDNFPLPNIHILVDNCPKHEIQSFMDCYAGYHQILMDEEDAEKTAFTTPWGTYCYRVMPFGLKNAGATYMRAMTTILHDMMHKEIEVYVDNVIIKSKTQADHVRDLRKFFERLWKYNLKLNPAKCAFGVPSGKLLGFIVSRRGIELDPSKIKAIRELLPPKNRTEVMSLLGRLNYISRFIAQLTTTCEPIFKLLKKDAAVKWTDERQEAFDKIKEYLSNPPVLVPPEPGRPLFLYLSVMDNSFGCVLGQYDATGKKEQAIYYLSKKFTSYEVKYTFLEKTCCALTWVAQKLKHYLSSYTTHLISRMDPLKYIFQKPMPSGRLAKWQILLTEFDIIYVTRTAINAQALADHLAENPVNDEYEPLNTYFPDEEINSVEEEVRDDSHV
ncbi:uncharacterized protein LOC132628461 [Lycium barbarum]|uniref:uncharacterized protein LOC132628461 n=1 Tax=Lycium barbarum TaxID=112863 RepID=UPI00293F0063|nr:uncharacterized protein LOC132628461 [Lycium barbarum]